VPDWNKDVTTALVLLFASAIAGLATGLFLRVWALLLVSPATAILAAIVLQASGFGVWSGVPIIIGSLIAGQLAYMVAVLHLHKGELSAQDQIDGAPGQHGQCGVGDENE
jgi:hypothetical protein